MNPQLPLGSVGGQSLSSSPVAGPPTSEPPSADAAFCSPPVIQKIFAKGSVPYRGQWYCSLREAACSGLMQEFIPSFLPIPGETIQVPIGFGRSVDFRLGGSYIEYHEPRIFVSSKKLGEYKSWFEYRAFLRELDRARPSRRDSLIDNQRQTLLDRYTMRRRRALDEHPDSRGAELVVVHDFDSIYDLVIKRFSPFGGEEVRDEARILHRTIEGNLIKNLNKRAKGEAIAA